MKHDKFNTTAKRIGSIFIEKQMISMVLRQTKLITLTHNQNPMNEIFLGLKVLNTLKYF